MSDLNLKAYLHLGAFVAGAAVLWGWAARGMSPGAWDNTLICGAWLAVGLWLAGNGDEKR